MKPNITRMRLMVLATVVEPLGQQTCILMTSHALPSDSQTDSQSFLEAVSSFGGQFPHFMQSGTCQCPSLNFECCRKFCAAERTCYTCAAIQPLLCASRWIPPELPCTTDCWLPQHTSTWDQYGVKIQAVASCESGTANCRYAALSLQLAGIVWNRCAETSSCQVLNGKVWVKDTHHAGYLTRSCRIRRKPW